MIHQNKTKLIQGKSQRVTHVWVTCDYCGAGRWSQPGNAERMSEGHPCRSCSNKRAWDGKRIDLSDGMRECVRCGEYKPIEEFARDKNKRAGIKGICLECSAKEAAQYRERYPERSKHSKRIAQAKRRAQKNGSNGSFTVKDWEEILEQYGHKCLCCGATEDLQPDHVVALSKGGAHDKGNIQPLCGLCNRRKQADTVDYRR